MAVDPYSLCPCGSGQKFKWCCHKVEDQAERADRLFRSGQAESAVQVLDEGLRKDPGNPWLLTRKASYLIQLGQNELAKTSLRQVLQRNPKHFGASILLTRLALETEGPAAGASHFQETLAVCPPEHRANLATLAEFVGLAMNQYGKWGAAIAHLRLAEKLEPKKRDQESHLPTIERSESVPAWVKQPYVLLHPTAKLSPDVQQRFDQAVKWADDGLWSSAAAAFEILSGDATSPPEASFNLGLCRFWMADDAGAASAFRRYARRLGNTIEAVDIEALVQLIEPANAEDLVEHVQLIWPLRDREGLLGRLRADNKIEELGSSPIDPNEPESPKVEHFGILDRPTLEAPETGLRPEDIPLFVAKILVGHEIVAVETYDDGRLDGIVERFTTLAAGAIAPAHPKTKVLEQASRRTLALSWEWLLPEGLDEKEGERLDREQCARLVRDVWTKTPMPFLGNRTPNDASKNKDSVVPLRAALCLLENSSLEYGDLVDFPRLREGLGVGLEPAIDPATVDVDALHIARLRWIPADQLDDERLGKLYRRARRYALSEVMDKTARALVDRPSAWEKVGVQPVTLFSQLALLASNAEKKEEALSWVEKGRQADPAPKRAAHAPIWEMVEVRIRAVSEPFESWVPTLSITLDRYKNDPAANQVIMLNLMEMGLLRLVPSPERNGEVLLDSRPLQAVLAEYGPRITTASGQLGVSASKGGIWTPGGDTAGAGGGLWTPGSDTGASRSQPDKPKLILPGS